MSSSEEEILQRSQRSLFTTKVFSGTFTFQFYASMLRFRTSKITFTLPRTVKLTSLTSYSRRQLHFHKVNNNQVHCQFKRFFLVLGNYKSNRRCSDFVWRIIASLKCYKANDYQLEIRVMIRFASESLLLPAGCLSDRLSHVLQQMTSNQCQVKFQSCFSLIQISAGREAIIDLLAHCLVTPCNVKCLDQKKHCKRCRMEIRVNFFCDKYCLRAIEYNLCIFMKRIFCWT